MNRYLLAVVLGAIAFLSLWGIGRGGDVLRRAGDASRTSISANPSSAAEGSNLAGIESAGENVMRQTSPEAMERLGTLADAPANTAPATSNLNPGASDTFDPSNPNATPPVPPSTTPEPAPQPAPAPATPPPTDQEAIPALW